MWGRVGFPQFLQAIRETLASLMAERLVRFLALECLLFGSCGNRSALLSFGARSLAKIANEQFLTRAINQALLLM